MAGTSFKMVGMSGMTAAFGRAASRVSLRQELCESIGEALVSSTIERFESETGPSGDAWPKSKRAQLEGGQTLSDSGGLKSSVAYEASPAMVAVGTSKVYAAIHQFGGDIVPKKAKKLIFTVGGKTVAAKKVTMPPRPFIGINADDIEEAKALIQEFILGGFK